MFSAVLSWASANPSDTAMVVSLLIVAVLLKRWCRERDPDTICVHMTAHEVNREASLSLPVPRKAPSWYGDRPSRRK
jgi:hypothetical protein